MVNKDINRKKTRKMTTMLKKGIPNSKANM